MAGTIVADIIQSDQSYASSINIASPMVVSNTISMTNGAISGNVNFDSGTLFVDSVNNRVGVGTQNPTNPVHIKSTSTNSYYKAECVTGGEAGLQMTNSAGGLSTWIYRPTNMDSLFIYHNGAERWMMDDSGRIRSPYQPAFGAYKTNGNQTSAGQITFDGTDSNTGGYFSTSTSRFTAPVAGRYFFTCSLLRLTGYTVNWYIRKNGSGILSYVEDTQSSSQYSMSTQSTVVDLVANDYIDIYMTSAGGIYGSSRYGTFCGFLIG